MNSAQIQSWLESHHSAMCSDLIELCNQNSGSSNLVGLQSVASWLEDWLPRDLSCQATRVDLPQYELITDNGQVEHRSTGPLLRWDFEPHLKRRILFAIHYDTVFSANSPFQTCEQIAEDRLQGPGVADAKGGIVVIRYALRLLNELGLLRSDAPFGISVVFNPDEEIGSLSSSAELQRLAADFEYALLFEPRLPTGELVSQRKGSGNYDIVVRGKSAHAGRHFEAGRNAITAICRLLGKLDALNGERIGTTINIGAISGGGPVNIVPDLCVGRFNVRVADRASSDWFTEQLSQAVTQLSQSDGFQCEVHGGITSPPKLIDEPMKQLMKRIESSHQKCLGRELAWLPTGGVCDGNKLAAAGLTNIDTLGPIGGGLHSHQEWVQLSSLAEQVALVVEIVRSV